MRYILSIDAGGTALKVAIYDANGRELAAVSELPRLFNPVPGWNERDADAMWLAVAGLVRRGVAEAGIAVHDIGVVGLTGYGNGLLLVDAAGKPVRNAILSSDQRAAGIVEEWRAGGLEASQYANTHQRLFAGKTLALLEWVVRYEPEVMERAAHVLQCKDFIRYRLTGEIGLEVGDASSGGFLDHGGRRFTPTVLEHFGLGRWRHLFSATIEPLSIAGGVSREAAEATGLRVGTPVSAGYADGPAMLLALGITDGALLNVVAGTWGLNQVVAREPVSDGSILGCTLGARAGEYILVDGGVTSASAFEWFVEMLRPGGSEPVSYGWYGEEVAKLPLDDPPVYFLPYVYGRLDRPEARGAFIGLSAWHRLPHMARAIFEGVAMEHRQHVERLLAGREQPRAIRFAGGAARSPAWLEIFAATLKLPIELSAAQELGALGAAIIGAVGAGIHPDLETAVALMTRTGTRIEPDPARALEMDRRYVAFTLLRSQFEALWKTLQA
jgi:L-xylulokinase